jgi:hypothetical protein
MNQLRQVIMGILAALLSAAIILGSMSLAFTEGSRRVAQSHPSQTISPSSVTFTTPLPSESTPALPSPTNTPAPTLKSICSYPPGWKPIIIKAGDTWESLTQTYGSTTETLAVANCLPPDFKFSNDFVGATFYVPPLLDTATLSPSLSPSETPTSEAAPTDAPIVRSTSIPCNPIAGWVKNYVVKKGDTLYHIATLFGTSVAQLQIANCMGYSVHIEPGWLLWVPNVPILTDTPTRLPSFTPSLTPGELSTPTVIPSATITSTPLPSPTPPIEHTVPPPPSDIPVTPTMAPPPSNTPPPSSPGTTQ